MFEEICLSCGKPLKEDGRAYCSEDCQNMDTVSPSLSSSSSAFSSPHIDYAVGGDVPALVPSALGFALRKYHRYSSSSASSTAWSIATDEDDQDDVNFGVEHGLQDLADIISDGSSKSPSFFGTPLSYARRPSVTNNGGSAAHGRSSSSRHVRSTPQNVPVYSPSSTEDDEFQSDSGTSFHEEESIRRSFVPGKSAPDGNDTITSKTKRSRNRASLPAYFSLLQMPSTSPSSSANTIDIARPSPPTPKLTLAGLSQRRPPFSLTAPPTAMINSRGRPSESSERRGLSRSNSRTRERQTTLTNQPPPTVAHDIEPRSQSKEPLIDWSTARGRRVIRRNSSPPPKMIIEPRGSPSRAASSGAPRGRARVDELYGIGGTEQAPGFGHGRTGLLDREHRRAGRFFRC
ncbi:hypothetical protein C8J56DRAFT_956236 [Mycena floridula]|nr:hypothetical protein C8J56DRAFT_956236 [Mycena floridula]